MRSRFFSTLLLVIACHVHGSAPGQPNDVEKFECVIIGGGVGGGTAAIYLARAGFHPFVIERSSPGSAIVQSEAIENWPGALKIRGVELMERIRQQAEINGAVFFNGDVISVDFSKKPFTITVRSQDSPGVVKTVQAKSCIIATGSSPKNLHIPGESEYWAKGVSSCAICDGGLYRGKRVGIVGGGDSAVLEAAYLSKIAKEVTVFVRKEQFKAVDAKKKEALLALPNVKVLYQTALLEIKGNGQRLTGVTAVSINSAPRDIELDGLFLAIGSKPSTSLFKGQIDLDERGYIVLKAGQQTSVEGVYAIGDVVDPLYKQAISAAGDGAKAALAMIQKDLTADTPPLSVAIKEIAPKAADLSAIAPDQPSVIEITSRDQFEKEIKMSKTPLVVDFYASWCPPCKRVDPKLESAAGRLAGKVRFLKVNVDRLGDLTTNYNISSMPTVLFFDKEGAIQDRKVGEQEIGELLNLLAN
jgi:thioredoxin-disulfide reductase/thioredoxin